MQDRAQNTRKKILAAAEWEFSEKGLYGAWMTLPAPLA